MSGLGIVEFGIELATTYYFSTHGCNAAFSSFATVLEDEAPFAAAAFAAAARALLSKKLAMVCQAIYFKFVSYCSNFE